MFSVCVAGARRASAAAVRRAPSGCATPLAAVAGSAQDVAAVRPRCAVGVLSSSVRVGVAPAGIGSVRCAMTKMARKRIRKKRAADVRALLKYAERYDPMRKCVRSVYQTLKRMGWEFEQAHEITEGCHAMFAMVDQLVAIEVVSPYDYAEAPALDTQPSELVRTLTAAEVKEAKKTFHIPHTVTGLVHSSLVDPPALNKETKAKHDLIQAKGWQLMVIHQPEWAECLEHPRQHMARYDYVVQRALRLREGTMKTDLVRVEESDESEVDSEWEWDADPASAAADTASDASELSDSDFDSDFDSEFGSESE